MTVTSAPEITLIVQPTLLFRLIKAFERRSPECPNRVIGVILGTRDLHEHIYESVHSYPVRHSEDGPDVAIDLDQLSDFLEFHRQVHGKRSALLGWYSMQVEASFWPAEAEIESVSGQPQTGTRIFRANNLFLNEIFAAQVKDASTGSWSTAPPCIFLQVQLCKNGSISVETFVNGHQDEDGVYQLLPIPHYIHSHDMYEKCLTSALKRILSEAARASCNDDLGTVTVPIHSITKASQDFALDLQGRLDKIKSTRSDEDSQSTEIEKACQLLPDPSILNKLSAAFQDNRQRIVSILEAKLASMTS